MSHQISAEQLQKLLEMASKQLGVTPKQLQTDLENGRYNHLLNNQKNVDQVKKIMKKNNIGRLYGEENKK